MGCIHGVQRPRFDGKRSEGDLNDEAFAMEMKGEQSTDKDKTREKSYDDIGNTLVRAQKKKVGKDDFELLHVIGRGSFGKVMQVRHKIDNKIYAMKVINKDAIIARNQIVHTLDEKNILQTIHHPFIVKLNYAFQTNDKLFLILDYVNGGELFFHLKCELRFSEERTRIYAAEICTALLHLHSHGIIYRDLKPENILLDSDGHIVITDFGLSKEVLSQAHMHTFCGTPEYLAPEILLNKGYSYPVDWWSFGCLIYEMLIGIPPFYSENLNTMYKKVLMAPLVFPQSISEDAKSLLISLLERDPNKRLGGPIIKNHPFFKEIDWESLVEKKVQMPWKANVKDAMDISHIDENFTKEKIGESYYENDQQIFCDEDKNLFEGFTFSGDFSFLAANK